MAQTKRKRQTKHRGNAAGVVEARGRTGRPPTAEERKQTTKAQARESRLNTPPTWKGASQRALIGGALMFVFLLVVNPSKHSHDNRFLMALLFAVVAMVIYIPAGFYIDQYFYRRRQAKRT